MDSAKQALRKVRTLPVGFEGRAIIVAVMVLAAGLYGVEPADAGLKHVAGLDTAVMHALWGTSRRAGPRKLCLPSWCQGTEWHRAWWCRIAESAGWRAWRAPEGPRRPVRRQYGSIVRPTGFKAQWGRP